MSDQRKIIFLHLPKTGGSTLVNILHQHYGLEQSALIAGDDKVALADAIQAGIPFIHGHFSAKLLKAAPNYYKATMLREASDRVISRYVHLAHSKEERLQKEFASYSSFEDFLQSTYADNWQVRMLSGQWHEGHVNEESYLKAVDQLYDFDWVATADQMAKAALDLSLKLGFESYYHPHLNTRASQELWQELNAKYRDSIADLNRFDAQLVVEARAIFNRNKKLPFGKGIKLKLKGLFS
ncbi:sulfotransferase family 2 domain-containing protein [Croceimicrobium sp.]|uniref:sulfotransferase family 2 domain-containing protein n=1 Tax=Croceimicrobium sp. TaxID=2828340 RepID=UPI003BABA562